MEKLQIKRSIALTAVSIMVSFITFIKVTEHSNIKGAEVLIILALGMGISALLFNLAHLYKFNKGAKTQIRLHQPRTSFNKKIILITSSAGRVLSK